jgi:hypothetical protein
MIANVFVNLYMLSVKLQQVIIANPKDLPIDGLAFIPVIVGIFWTRQRIKSDQNNPVDPQSRGDGERLIFALAPTSDHMVLSR